MPFRPLTSEEEERWGKVLCKHQEHNPPSLINLPPGVHIWVCPACGAETKVVVDKETLTKGTKSRKKLYETSSYTITCCDDCGHHLKGDDHDHYCTHFKGNPLGPRKLTNDAWTSFPDDCPLEDTE